MEYTYFYFETTVSFYVFSQFFIKNEKYLKSFSFSNSIMLKLNKKCTGLVIKFSEIFILKISFFNISF